MKTLGLGTSGEKNGSIPKINQLKYSAFSVMASTVTKGDLS